MQWTGPGGGREVLRLAWPLILGNSFFSLQIALDRVFLGWRSSNDTAAAMAGAMLFWAPLTLLQFTVNYVTTFVAQYRGAGQPERVGHVVWQSLFLALAGGLAFLLLSALVDPAIIWAGHAEGIQTLEKIYLRCLCFAALPYLLLAGVSGFFAGLGRSGVILVLNVVGLVVHGLFAYGWIFGAWGMPELGIAGAGWAMVLGGWAPAGLGLLLFLSPANRREFGLVSGLRLDLSLMMRFLRYGVPNGFIVMMETLGFALALTFLGRIGELPHAASTIAFTLNIPAYLPTMGIAQAVGVLVGQRLGEDRPDLARRSVATGVWLALGFVALIAANYVFLPEFLVGVFAEKQGANWDRVAALSVQLLRFVAVYAFFDGIALVYSFALRGAGDTVFVGLASLVLAWPIMVLPAWLQGKPEGSVFLTWAGISGFPVASALVLLVRFRQGQWQQMRVIQAHVPR